MPNHAWTLNPLLSRLLQRCWQRGYTRVMSWYDILVAINFAQGFNANVRTRSATLWLCIFGDRLVCIQCQSKHVFHCQLTTKVVPNIMVRPLQLVTLKSTNWDYFTCTLHHTVVKFISTNICHWWF
jgi:hypothetical protein